MENFTQNARRVLAHVHPSQKTGGDLARHELSHAQFKACFEYNKPSDRARATLYFFLDELLTSRDVEQTAELVLRNLYCFHAAFANVSDIHPNIATPILTEVFALPPVDMAQLVNQILRTELDPGSNRVLVYRQSTQSFVLGLPSATDDSGISWQVVGNYVPPPTLIAQFEQIDAAIAAVAHLFDVAPVLNSEGRSGPVAGWGGD